MTEHDLHEPLRRLAETAPAPAPGLAGEVVERGRTARRRRLGGVTVAGAAVAAAMVVLVPLFGSGSGGERGAEPPVVTDPTTTTEPPPPPEPSARMKVAAAAIDALLRDGYPAAHSLSMKESICVRKMPLRSRNCTALTKAEMADLEWLLDYQIRWVDRAPRDFGPRAPYVGITALRNVDASGGSVFVTALAGGLDCLGSSYHVNIYPDRQPVAAAGRVSLIC